ncbi:MAG: hypothetical protein WCS65_07710 [Verrucomicrobiae bacterium]
MNSQIAEFVERGASHITPHTLEKLLHQLPLLKVEFTQIIAPKYPHLVDQLEFLSDVVEDVAERTYERLSYHALAAAAFALIYAHKAVDLIPDSNIEFGHADDSAVVRYVLLRYERCLSDYADHNKVHWNGLNPAP